MNQSQGQRGKKATETASCLKGRYFCDRTNENSQVDVLRKTSSPSSVESPFSAVANLSDGGI